MWAKEGEFPGTAFTRSFGDSMAEQVRVECCCVLCVRCCVLLCVVCCVLCVVCVVCDGRTSLRHPYRPYHTLSRPPPRLTRLDWSRPLTSRRSNPVCLCVCVCAARGDGRARSVGAGGDARRQGGSPVPPSFWPLSHCHCPLPPASHLYSPHSYTPTHHPGFTHNIYNHPGPTHNIVCGDRVGRRVRVLDQPDGGRHHHDDHRPHRRVPRRWALSRPLSFYLK